MKRKSTPLAIAALITAPLAFAQADAELGWALQRNSLLDVNDSTIGTATDFSTVTRIIEFSAPGTPILMLTCQYTSNGKSYLNAGFQLDPDDAPDHSGKRKLTAQSVSGVVTIGGKKEATRWFYQPTTTRLAPKDRTIGPKMFNAAARSDAISIKVLGSKHEMQLPPPNTVLGDFAKWCPETNGGVMNMSIFSDPTKEAAKTSSEF